jgi:hypothetical protein
LPARINEKLKQGRKMAMNHRELSTVLAALHYWQRTIIDYGGPVGPESDIADDGGSIVALTADEITSLCERLNHDEV